jgi:hypothetical protein
LGILHRYELAASITPEAITLRLAKLCANNAILWGKDVPKPKFHVQLDCTQSYVYHGRTTTAKLVAGGVDFMRFFASADDADALQTVSNQAVDVIATLSLNEYNGVVKPQAIIESYEIATRAEQQPDISWEEIFK